jgi:hypothetical protein
MDREVLAETGGSAPDRTIIRDVLRSFAAGWLCHQCGQAWRQSVQESATRPAIRASKCCGPTRATRSCGSVGPRRCMSRTAIPLTICLPSCWAWAPPTTPSANQASAAFRPAGSIRAPIPPQRRYPEHPIAYACEFPFSFAEITIYSASERKCNLLRCRISFTNPLLEEMCSQLLCHPLRHVNLWPLASRQA